MLDGARRLGRRSGSYQSSWDSRLDCPLVSRYPERLDGSGCYACAAPTLGVEQGVRLFEPEYVEQKLRERDEYLRRVPFPFPPQEPHSWVALTEERRELWLSASCACHFAATAMQVPRPRPGRTVYLDGRLIDSTSGFLCALGEAVNGPGGYFGLSLLAFEDCIYGGFGLDRGSEIVWQHSDRSRGNLGTEELIRYYELLDAVWDLPDDRDALAERIARARSERWTLFDTIVELVEPSASCKLVLR
ncbi:MAG: barstar family protein [Alphaproteobacteria bacterium]